MLTGNVASNGTPIKSTTKLVKEKDNRYALYAHIKAKQWIGLEVAEYGATLTMTFSSSRDAVNFLQILLIRKSLLRPRPEPARNRKSINEVEQRKAASRQEGTGDSSIMETELDGSIADEEPKPPLWHQPEQDLANGNMQVDDAACIPAEMKKHLDFIDIRQAGQLLLGTSSLTSRYWTGGVWLFEKASDAPDAGRFTAARETESGVTCGRFIDGLGVRAVVCQDLGTVEVLGWEPPDPGSEEDRLLVTHGRSAACDGSLLALDTLPAGQAGGDADMEAVRAVTGSSEGRLHVWDLETLVAELSYTGAHRHWVTGVASHPSQPHQLVSCGLDGEVLMWDTRAARPASRLAGGSGDRPLCCSWSPTDPATVAVGWESGRLSLLNTVSRAETAAARRARPLHRLCWHPRRPWVAACGDQTTVEVFTAEERLSVVHRDELHTDMVRGLAWLPDSDTLYSCGWDRAVRGRPIG